MSNNPAHAWAVQAKHDLGEAVAWRSHNHDDQAWLCADAALVEDIHADLWHARDNLPNWQLGDDLRARCPPALRDEVGPIDVAIATLHAHAMGLTRSPF